MNVWPPPDPTFIPVPTPPPRRLRLLLSRRPRPSNPLLLLLRSSSILPSLATGLDGVSNSQAEDPVGRLERGDDYCTDKMLFACDFRIWYGGKPLSATQLLKSERKLQTLYALHACVPHSGERELFVAQVLHLFLCLHGEYYLLSRLPRKCLKYAPSQAPSYRWK